MAIELTGDMNLEQRVGIFEASPEVRADEGLKRWLARLPAEMPTVVEEEKYYRIGIERKLKTSYRVIRKLARYGILRPLESGQFSRGEREPVSTSSLAQTISWAYGRPIEDILREEKTFKSREFLKKRPVDRVATLVNAYTGTEWFEFFRNVQRGIAKKQKPPKVKTWQRISRQNLEDWFVSSNCQLGLVRRLCEKGIIIPRFGKGFISRSFNIVDPYALARFISFLYGADEKEVLDESPDPYISELGESFIRQKLLPYLEANGIYPTKNYSIARAAKITGMRYQRLHQAVERESIRSSRSLILGIDLALYALRRTDKMLFTEEDIADLFGVDSIDCHRLNIQMSGRDTYSRHHYVFPTYDLIAEQARTKVMNALLDQPLLLEISGKSYEFTIGARIQYCRLYGLKNFEYLCAEHLREQARRTVSIRENEIETEHLEFTTKGNRITRVRMSKLD